MEQRQLRSAQQHLRCYSRTEREKSGQFYRPYSHVSWRHTENSIFMTALCQCRYIEIVTWPEGLEIKQNK